MKRQNPAGFGGFFRRNVSLITPRAAATRRRPARAFGQVGRRTFTHFRNSHGPVRMKMPVRNAAPLVAFAVVTFAFSNASEARPRHHHAHHARHHAAHHGYHHHSYNAAPDNARAVLTPPPSFDSPAVFPQAAAPAAQPQRLTRYARRMARHAPAAAPAPSLFSAGGSDIVAEARRYIGGNPTGRRSLWCGRFMNFVLDRTGHKDSGSDLARSFASYGRRVAGPQVGAIAVMSRRGGGHVGVVSGIDPKGNPIVISGNHGNRVAEAVYPASRIYAYVLPM
jgi:uncharacterized protein (TIGR02594 family)